MVLILKEQQCTSTNTHNITVVGTESGVKGVLDPAGVFVHVDAMQLV